MKLTWCWVNPKSFKMPDILLIGNPKANFEQVQKAQKTLSSNGVVGFEQLDRLSSSKIPALTQVQLKPLEFQKVISGSLLPTAFSHSPAVLAQFAKTLKTGGTLELTEPILLDSAAVIKLEELGSGNELVPRRTERSLSSELVMNGFVNINMLQKRCVDKLEIKDWLEIWGLEGRKDIEEFLLGTLQVISIACERPSYAVGAGAKLSFGKKKPVAMPTQEAPKKAVWTISSLDDEVELEDEDNLLDEEDLVVPPTAAPGDCSTRKKACKDCSCGRAEEEEKELVAAITFVAPKKAVASSCGSVNFFLDL